MTAIGAKTLASRLGLRDPQNRWVERARRLRRILERRDRRLRDMYLRDDPQPKLQVGGGWHRLDGWLNTDLSLVARDVMLMDATQAFPLPDDTFCYVYTEHMIEHVPYGDAAGMLRQCYRVLRPGGVLRVVTPDLAAILSLYGPSLSDLQQRYLSWFCGQLLPAGHPRSATSVVNAMFRLWGHQFIYDEITLADALVRAGFHTVVRRRLGESEHIELRGLENTGRYPDGLLEYESIALEARK
jgi:predicted SAM-dependent methyltransferase